MGREKEMVRREEGKVGREKGKEVVHRGGCQAPTVLPKFVGDPSSVKDKRKKVVHWEYSPIPQFLWRNLGMRWKWLKEGSWRVTNQ